jgi:hypothetical protein
MSGINSLIGGGVVPLDTPLEQGDTVVVVRDSLLAAAMIAAGIELRHDPAYLFVKLENGHEQWSFNFKPCDKDNDVQAKDCIEGWKEYLNWVKHNPTHPFAFAMCAVRNYIAIREHQQTARPFHAYRMPPEEEGQEPPTLLVMANSEKERLAIEKGYQRL